MEKWWKFIRNVWNGLWIGVIVSIVFGAVINIGLLIVTLNPDTIFMVTNIFNDSFEGAIVRIILLVGFAAGFVTGAQYGSFREESTKNCDESASRTNKTGW